MTRCVDGRTDAALWAEVKKAAVRKLGRHSARAMQLAGRLYREAGGGYCGKRTKQQEKLTRWTREEWQTAPGAPAKACRRLPSGKLRCDRYLPKAAWQRLSPSQREATRRVKKSASRQYVPNAPAAARAGRAARAR